MLEVLKLGKEDGLDHATALGTDANLASQACKNDIMQAKVINIYVHTHTL